MNSAYEIATVLERFAETAGNTSLSSRWATELQCVEGGADYFLALAILQAKLEGLRSQVALASIGDRPKSLYIGAIDNLSPFLRPDQAHQLTTGQINGQKTHIDLLFIAAETLPHDLVPDVNPLTLETLIQELESLIAAADSADLEFKLRQIIVSQLATLLMAIRSYGVFGPEGVARIFGSVAAELLRVSGSPTAQTPEGQNALAKALSFVKKVGAVIVFTAGIVSGVNAILTDGRDLLGLTEQENRATPDAPSEHPTALPASSEHLAQSDTQQSDEGS